MKGKGKRIAMVIFSILPLLMVLSVYSKLPELVPLQWNAGGVSHYGNKWELFLVAELFIFIGNMMPKVKNNGKKCTSDHGIWGTFAV